MPVMFTDGRKGLVLISKEYEESTLMHYRVGGEKKGVRRWQDKSGRLTDAGYKHYAEMYGWGKKRTFDDEALDTKQYVKKIKSGNHTNSSYRFSSSAYKIVADEQVMNQVKSKINNDKSKEVSNLKMSSSNLLKARKIVDETFDKYDKQWVEDHPEEWDGDGTEYHWELEKTYPEYKQAYDTFEKELKEFIITALKTSKLQSFQDIKGSEKYDNYYEKIYDVRKNKFWYKASNVTAFAIAKAAIGNDATFLIFPEEFIESFDNKWNKLKDGW